MQKEEAPGGVRVFERQAGARLRPFVRRFLVVEFASHTCDVHLPDPSPVAAFSFRGRCRLDGGDWAPAAVFTGLHERLRRHEHGEGHAVVLATFTPVGAAAFLRPPQEEFAGMSTDLADVFIPTADLERLHEQLTSAPDHLQRIGRLAAFLLARLRLAAPDPLVAAAVAWLERENGPHRIDDLTRHIGLSQSALERRFRRVVGISPKKFAGLARLQRALRMRAAGADLTTLAHAAGYFDQSHFIHDFRQATGSAPEAFFRGNPMA